MKKILTLSFAAFMMATMCTMAQEIKSGINIADMNPQMPAGEDFYEYAGGGWMKAHPLTAEYSRYGVFNELNEKNREQLKELFAQLAEGKHPKGSVGQKVTDLYQLAMDSVRLNREGTSPLATDLQEINKVTKAGLTASLADIHLHLLANPFFGIGVDGDLKNSSMNVVYLEAGTTGLPDRDYYLKNDEDSKQIQEKYRQCMQKLLEMAGYSRKDAKRVITTVYKMEYAFAEASLSRVEARDYTKQYNIYDIAKLQKEYPSIQWRQYFDAMGLSHIQQVILTQPKVMAVVENYLSTLKEQEIRDYLSLLVIRGATNYLSDDFAETAFDFYGRTLSGQKERQPRWKRAQSLPNSLLGEAVGQLYVEKYFSKDAKAKILQLVGNLRKSLAEHIATLTWMSDSTKINALVKLNAFNVKVGYPDKWRDYNHLTIDPEKSLYENIKAASYCETLRQLKKAGKPVDKDEWYMTPQTINAYYSPLTNEIVFPAGILQAPFFDPNVDDAVNYGAIGGVIGHEMTHGFDDQGCNFDADGNMNNWWSETDKANFKASTEKLADQFDQIVVVKDQHANGKLTLGENIADQGGLRIAYDAFKKTRQGAGNEEIDGFTPDQRFYLSYGRIWAQNITDEAAFQLTKTDPHSLGRWRVNATLRNIDTFFQAFQIKKGDKMYLAPEDRVVIW